MLLGGYFLYSGINHFRQHNTLAEYASSKNVPAPDAGVIATGVALTVGGASTVLGVKPKLGAAAIIGFLAGVSPIMHDFWNHEDPSQRQADMNHFTKNMALLGGALVLAGIEEPWPISLAEKRKPGLRKVLAFSKRLVA